MLIYKLWKWDIKYILQQHWRRPVSSNYHSKGKANLFLIELCCSRAASGCSGPLLMGSPPCPSTCRWQRERDRSILIKWRSKTEQRVLETTEPSSDSQQRRKKKNVLSHQSRTVSLWCPQIWNSRLENMGRMMWCWASERFPRFSVPSSFGVLDLYNPKPQGAVFQG